MSVYMVVEIEVLNAALYAKYVENVAAIVTKYGGRYLVRGGAVTSLAGGWNPERIIIVEFPSPEEVRRWLSSPEYQELAPLREASTLSRAILLEGYGEGRRTKESASSADLGAADPNPGRDPVQPLPTPVAEGLLRLEALKSMERVKP
jgi:uncharacterized protein (DUF1330 family)